MLTGLSTMYLYLRPNVPGTVTLLDAAREYDIENFIHIPTDEVYMSTVAGSFVETDNLGPSSPYSASKASSDLLARPYLITHSLPVLITRCTNNYGPYQHPEKLIPLFVTNLLEGKKFPYIWNGRERPQLDLCYRSLSGDRFSSRLWRSRGDLQHWRRQ